MMAATVADCNLEPVATPGCAPNTSFAVTSTLGLPGSVDARTAAL
jgi:hypothetical protein